MKEEERSRKYEVRGEMTEVRIRMQKIRAGIQQSIGGFNIDDIVNATLEEERLAEIERKKSKTRDAKDQKSDKKETADNNMVTRSSRKNKSFKKRIRYPVYTLEEFHDRYKVSVEISPRTYQEYTFSKSIYPLSTTPTKRTYMDWMREIKKAEQIRYNAEYFPASTREIHILASAAHYYHTTGSFAEIGENAGRFIANAIQQHGIGAYTRIQLSAQPIIIHSEWSRWQTQHKIPKQLAEIIDQNNRVALCEEESLTKLLFNDTIKRTFEIYKWIGTLCNPKRAYIGPGGNFLLQIDQNSIITYNCTDDSMLWNYHQPAQLVLELTRKTLDEEFWCIGVKRTRMVTR